MTDPPFQRGDRVRLKTGKSQIKVLEVGYFHCASRDTSPPKTKLYRKPRKGWFIRFAYVSSLRFEMENSYDRTWREADDFVLFDPQPEKEEEMTDTVLYETKDGKFGTKCGENSEGKWIIELKGAGGEVAPYDKKDLTEVVPYSVELVRVMQEFGVKSERRFYHAEKDSVEVGDLLMQVTTGALWRVAKIDTKTRNLSKTNNSFVKLATEKTTVGKD